MDLEEWIFMTIRIVFWRIVLHQNIKVTKNFEKVFFLDCIILIIL